MSPSVICAVAVDAVVVGRAVMVLIVTGEVAGVVDIVFAVVGGDADTTVEVSRASFLV